MIDMVLSRAFFPLLEWVDEGLYRHLHRYGMTLPTFSRQWVACWFAQDIPDVAVASRLADAFLVSHPLMPLYTSVALLTTSRDQIMNCDSHLSTLYTMLRGLPVQAIFEQDDRMKKIEEILSCALSYMYVQSCLYVAVLLLSRFLINASLCMVLSTGKSSPRKHLSRWSKIDLPIA